MIFDTWIDGWTNETGAIVGYFNAPFAEQSIVHDAGAKGIVLIDDIRLYAEVLDDSSADITGAGDTVAYRYYQIVLPTLRSNNDGLMQIAEVEFIGTPAE